jgi:hypothetical protein
MTRVGSGKLLLGLASIVTLVPGPAGFILFCLTTVGVVKLLLEGQNCGPRQQSDSWFRDSYFTV